MAGIVAGVAAVAVGGSDARRRPTQTQAPSTSPNTSSTTTTSPSADRESEAYFNAGTQIIKGLTNQTGYVKGDANGVINFGTLTSSAGARRA